MTNTRTSKFRRLYWLFVITSILLNISPLLIYIIKAFKEADLTTEKVTLSMTVFIVLIMTIISLINKITIKSRLWIILIGIYMCLDYIMIPLIIIAVCQIVDEIIICPLKKSFKNKLIINKEMDKRI